MGWIRAAGLEWFAGEGSLPLQFHGADRQVRDEPDGIGLVEPLPRPESRHALDSSRPPQADRDGSSWRIGYIVAFLLGVGLVGGGTALIPRGHASGRHRGTRGAHRIGFVLRGLLAGEQRPCASEPQHVPAAQAPGFAPPAQAAYAPQPYAYAAYAPAASGAAAPGPAASGPTTVRAPDSRARTAAAVWAGTRSPLHSPPRLLLGAWPLDRAVALTRRGGRRRAPRGATKRTTD